MAPSVCLPGAGAGTGADVFDRLVALTFWWLLLNIEVQTVCNVLFVRPTGQRVHMLPFTLRT